MCLVLVGEGLFVGFLFLFLFCWGGGGGGGGNLVLKGVLFE